MSATPESLQKFVSYCQQHITGDEKGQAQVFLDRFFQAFGHEGALEAGATYEERVKKGSKKGKTGFADLVWKPRLLIEMKKRGEDLSKHYSQAFDYWTRLVPDRPRYVLLGNFDEFWIFDFNALSVEEASDYIIPFEPVKATVKPERDKNRREVTRINWWKYGEKRPALRKAIASLSCYFTVPRVSKWAVFIPAPLCWLPGDLNIVVASDDFYILGILTSKIHRVWVKAQSSTLEDRTRYTHNTCFETFPFPQMPSSKLVEQIRATAQQLHQYRTQQMETKQWGITQLYNKFFNEPTSQLFKLHAQLDKQVIQAYGFDASDDILEKLLELNLELAEKEKRGETVVGPWAPH